MGIMRNSTPIALFNMNGNMKVNAPVFNTLYGDMIHHIDYHGHVFDCTGTCGEYCKACVHSCYCKKSAWRPNVKYSQGCNTLAIRENPYNACCSLIDQLKRTKKEVPYIRWHASGEFESMSEWMIVKEIAKQFPKTTIYTYTKNFELFEHMLSTVGLYTNVTVNFSIWHEVGIKEFHKYGYMPNVKAFVYDDHTFDYESHGIIGTTSCKAYNENGKLDHSITCGGTCKKCMYCSKASKVIMCNDH